MFADSTSRLPRAFRRLAWSNLAAQAAEQIGLSAALLLAVLVFSAGPGAVGAIGALAGASLGATACLAIATALFTLQAALILASPVVGLARLPPPEHAQPHAGSVRASRLVRSTFGRSSGKVRPSTI
jgi:hypothetical protein